MMDDYYESQEVEAARTELLAASARESADAGGRAGRPGGRPISISLAPLKSAVFGRWYDDVRPLLRRQLGLKAELPEPVYTEVRTRDSLDSLLARPRRPAQRKIRPAVCHLVSSLSVCVSVGHD